MDLQRVRAYLQVACAGLGFEVGELWWTSNEHGSPALAAGEEKSDSNHNGTVDHHHARPNGGGLRFVQLYTSKSFEEKRSMLVNPPEEEADGVLSDDDSSQNSNETNVKKHVLSPILVDATTKTAQVVWANTKKQEGLLGRSNTFFQTAVGMPVAVDAKGNMCVVVMFSPRNIPGTDDAVEYLKSISQSATSSQIPSLKPAFDPKAGLLTPHHDPVDEVIPLLAASSVTDGITAKFLSFEDHVQHDDLGGPAVPDACNSHDLLSAPKDCFGIPMLPAFAELQNAGQSDRYTAAPAASDAFDEASYGVWSTIMGTTEAMSLPEADLPATTPTDKLALPPPEFSEEATDAHSQDDEKSLCVRQKPFMSSSRRERLSEFATAFLDVSVFDLAEIWVPLQSAPGFLGHIMSVSSSNQNDSLDRFHALGERMLIKHWSGAIGRAFSSGNPVWSTNKNAFADSGRREIFEQSYIQTTLAVPVYSGKSVTPSFIFCCYSLVRTGSVPFVLKFVQQALKLLWSGLEQVEPHESVSKEMWRDVAPADLGEMAADVEMQHHFMKKKRPHDSISTSEIPEHSQIQELPQHDTSEVHASVPSARSIYTGRSDGSPPLDPVESPAGGVPYALQTFADMGAFQAHVGHAMKSAIHAPSFENSSNNNNSNSYGMHGQEQYESRSKRLHMSGPFDSTDHAAQDTDDDAPVFAQIMTDLAFDPAPVPNRVGNRQASTSSKSSEVSQMNPLPAPRPLVMPGPIMIAPLTMPNQSFEAASQNATGARMTSTTTQSNVRADKHNFNTGTSVFGNRDTTLSQEPSSSNGASNGTEARWYSNESAQNDFGTSEPLRQPQQGPNNAQFGLNPTNASAAAPAASAAGPATVGAHTNAFVYTAPQHIQSSSLPSNSEAASVPGSNMMFPGTIAFCTTIPAKPESTKASGTNGKVCRIQGCDEPTVSRRPYCARHSGNRLCEREGCTKCAQGSTRFCIAHGGGRRCTFPGCDKGARDKFFCAAHGGGKRCKHEGCSKSAVGGSNLCTAHGGGRRCLVPGCGKSAQSSTKYCVKHGGGKKCSHPNCEKVARGRTQFCAAHGGGVRCKLAGCNRVAIGKNQLCRAHGGGSRTKARASAAPVVPQQVAPPQNLSPQHMPQQTAPTNGGYHWSMSSQTANI